MARDIGQYHTQIGTFVNELCHLYYRYSQPEDRMDIRNEVASIAHQRQSDLQITDESQFLGWLHEVTRNVVRNWSRRAGTVARYTSGSLDDPTSVDALQNGLPSEALTPETLLFERERSQLLGNAIAELPQIHQQVVWLFYIEELPERDIAKQLGIRKGTVKSRLYHARKQLASALAPHMVDC